MIFLAMSIVPLIIGNILLIQSFEVRYETEKKNEMYRKANTIGTNLVVTGFFGEESNKGYLSTINAIVAGRALIINAKGSVIFDTNNTETGKLYATKEVIEALNGQSMFNYLEKEQLGKVVVPITDTDKNILGVVVLTNSFEDISLAMTAQKRVSFLIILGFAILTVLFSYYTAGLLTRPFKQFIQYIKGVTEGHIDEKLIVYGNNEIEEISKSFNLMIHRFLEVEENRQLFVANVSHELKTPISSIKVLAEALLTRENVPNELYREFLEDINSEVDRENKIINDLLTLVTLDKRENELNVSKVNINELVEAILKRVNPLAGKRNIQMIFESYRSVVAEIDETKLSLAITNLIENAIKYNKDFGLITTTLNADHKDFEITVKDTGIGIPEEDIEKIFERFYRIDKTRSRDTGGTGLGLSIVSKTVLMHKGAVKCESVLEKGTKFVVKIPLKYIN